MIKSEIIIPELNNKTIESMIYIIRGQKVMLDYELAKIYGYETKYFNRQINNNIERFDDEFRFRLTNDEFDTILRCKNFTTNNLSKRRTLPYAFTEQGIYMLMTVLKADTGFIIIVKRNNNRFHDRYIVLDYETKNETIYHSGASSKDAGKKITTIIRIEEKGLYKPLIDEILKNEDF